MSGIKSGERLDLHAHGGHGHGGGGAPFKMTPTTGFMLASYFLMCASALGLLVTEGKTFDDTPWSERFDNLFDSNIDWFDATAFFFVLSSLSLVGKFVSDRHP